MYQLDKKVLTSFYTSKEFELFKDALVVFEESISNGTLDDIITSIDLIAKTNESMKSRISKMYKSKLDDYLTAEQVSVLDLISDDSGIGLTYNKYVPSYKNKSGTYTPVNTEILKVDFKNKKVIVNDIKKEITLALERKSHEILEEHKKIQELKMKINNLMHGKESKTNVINTICENRKKELSTIDKLKIASNKEKYSGFIQEYNMYISNLREYYDVHKEELKKIKAYDYKNLESELIKLQKGVLKRLSELNFEVTYMDKNCDNNLINRHLKKSGKITENASSKARDDYNRSLKAKI